MGILGSLMAAGAGAAQGFGEASNRNVDMHNLAAIENMREQLREQFAQRQFARERSAQKEDRKLAAEHERGMYKLQRQDKLTDAEREFERDLKKLDIQSERDLRKIGIQESGRDRRAAMKAKQGLLEGGQARSTTGKTIQDLLDLGLAETPQQAYDLYEESGLARMIASSPTVIEPSDIIKHMKEWRKARRGEDVTSGGDEGPVFVRNPETGKIEMRKQETR